MTTAIWSRGRAALHGWAILTAVVTFVLICSGGLVTSKGVGMAVPDWPNTFGYNMFLFPVSRWVGGIFYEHTHRLIASLVGLMTMILVAGLLRYETRKWVTNLGFAAFVAVVIQGLLGGFRVILYRDEIGVFHGMLAQAFFAAIVVLAVATGRSFVERRWAVYEPNPAPRRWAIAAVGLVFLQLGLGATMRHEHIGLSIPDFPLAYGRILPDTSPAAMEAINAARVANNEIPTNPTQIAIQMVHRANAIVLLAVAVGLVVVARKSQRPTRFWAALWLTMVVAQVALGAWTIWSNKAADVATAHQALGALTLVLGVVIAFRLILGGRAGDFVLPDPTKPALVVA